MTGEAATGGATLRVGEQFADASQQRDAAALGIWIFLATEMMFFGALFFAYAIARLHAPEAFAAASRQTNVVIGTANTAILLTSSFFMAWAVRSAAAGARKATAWLLVLTATLGILFAGLKLTEYAIDYRDHLVPLVNFAFDPRYLPGALVFYGLYFATTGLHLVHLTVGVAVVIALAWQVWRKRRNALTDHVEVAGLYWHFVDVVWIFLYPCLYLISRA
jgi:cytochrome c oxidase subunit 3